MNRQVHHAKRLILVALLVSFSGMPIFAQSVPEACSGFGWPLDGTYAGDVYGCACGTFCNNGGYTYTQTAMYGPGCGTIHHPAEDFNIPCYGSGNADKGQPVYATADGLVVTTTSGWGALVIQHNYQGQTYYSQYGHSINLQVSQGQTVTKGQKVAELGDNGTNAAHLHFEIRRSSHPHPTDPNFYCTYNGLDDINNVLTWYADPDIFVQNRGPYNCNNNNCPPTKTVSQTIIGGTHTHKASDQLNADNLIKNGADVTYQGGNEVVLKKGFHAKKGVTLDANLDGCQ